MVNIILNGPFMFPPVTNRASPLFRRRFDRELAESLEFSRDEVPCPGGCACSKISREKNRLSDLNKFDLGGKGMGC